MKAQISYAVSQRKEKYFASGTRVEDQSKETTVIGISNLFSYLPEYQGANFRECESYRQSLFSTAGTDHNLSN